MSKFKKIIFSVAILSSCNSLYSLTLKQQNLYKKAETLLKNKDYNQYYIIKAKLKNTELYPYLKYKEILSNPEQFKQSTIDNYLHQYKNQYWVNPLKKSLAQYYAKNNDWKLFQKYYDNNLGTSGKCWNMYAEYELGHKSYALKQFGNFWQNRTYISNSCSEIEKIWNKKSHKLKKYVVNKAYTLAFSGKFTSAIKLIDKNIQDKKDYIDYLTAWNETIKNPNSLQKFISKYHNYRNFNKIIFNIIKKLSKKNNIELAKIWDNLNNKNILNTQVKHKCISQIAVTFARNQNKQADEWLDKVDKDYLDNVAWEWILRTAIYNENYKKIIQIYKDLPKNLKKEDDWRFWLGYSYKKENQNLKAKKIFEKLILEPLTYYSFLASDELGKKYNINYKKEANLTSKEQKQLLNNNAIEQAIDLQKIGNIKDSVDIWKWEIRKKLKDKKILQIQKLSLLAQKERMYYNALFNISVIGKYTNTPLLFPKAFSRDVKKASDKFNINRSLIYGIMRRESMFNPNASSWAGAKGLMQVTIPTAKFIAKKYRLKLDKEKNEQINDIIFNPYNNINIGTANLDFLDDLFNKNIVLGISAYNAGPGNIDKWLNSKKVPALNWIENIPFKETRIYIRKVLIYMIVYNNFIFKNDKKYKLLNFLNVKISDKQSFR